MIRCLNCNTETSNGLALCELCQRKALLDLEFLPVYFRNLTRWRPGKAGSRQVPGSRALYVGETRDDQTGDRISDRIAEAASAITGWAMLLTSARPPLPMPLTLTDAALVGDLPDTMREDQAAVMGWVCKAFEKHLTSIATLDWCGRFVADLARHETILRGLTEASIPGWYAGGCRGCGTGTYVVPGLTWVTCRGCGNTTAARDHLELILAEARDWVAGPKQLAGALVALLDTEQSVPRLYERIKKWGTREQVTAYRRLDDDGDEVGPKRYQLGEVLDRVLVEGQTRTKAKPSEKVGA